MHPRVMLCTIQCGVRDPIFAPFAPSVASPKKQFPTSHLTPRTAPIPPQSAAPEYLPQPLAHHYTPGPADAAQWTPPQEYQAWKTPPWYRHPSIPPVFHHNGPAGIFCHNTHVVAYQDYRFPCFVQHFHPGKELVQMSPVLPGSMFIQLDCIPLY